jgi:hypothetical protein
MTTAIAASPERGPARRVSALSLVTALSAAALMWGWNLRTELYITPQSGLGYILGIAGTSFMLLLLLYSLRKRVRTMRSWGPIRHWFAIHMVLGILGPVAILFHANFRLGSLNSTVAFSCVMLVAASGVIGRFIYPKIHHGLFGHRASLSDLKHNLEANRGEIGIALSASPRLVRKLGEFEAIALAESRGIAGSTWSFVTLPLRARWARRRALRDIAASPEEVRDAAEAVGSYVEGIRKVAEFDVYVRLFSLWHAFHLPICVMLFLAAAVHVIAVHMY